MPEVIRVDHVDGDQFSMSVRGHTVVIDQPTEYGGSDAAPTPTELFAASLAGCVAFYARRFLVRHEIPTGGLVVEGSFAAGGKPNRITDIAINVTPPDGLPESRRAAFLAVASGCTLHHTLAEPPAVSISLS